MAEQVGWQGLKELEATLVALPGTLGQRVLMGALRAGAKVIQDEAKARAPVLKKPHPYRKRGTVRDAIKVRRSKRQKFGVFVGIKPLKGRSIVNFKRSTGKGSNKNPDDPYYWWFREFGTRYQPAEPFLRPAFESRHREALARFNRYTLQRLEREAKKLARQKGLPQ